MKWLAVLAVLYVLSYVALTRCSLWIMAPDKVFGFYYVPCRLRTLQRHEFLQRVHVALCYFYDPVESIDRLLLKGPGVAGLPERDFEVGKDRGPSRPSPGRE